MPDMKIKFNNLRKIGASSEFANLTSLVLIRSIPGNVLYQASLVFLKFQHYRWILKTWL